MSPEAFSEHGLVGILLFVIVAGGASVFLFLKHLINLFMKQIEKSDEENRKVIENNTKALTTFQYITGKKMPD
jgi:hypothetical protein